MIRGCIPLLALALVACETESLDADGDGVIGIDDCDDDDASRYPGATEVCDGVDNDCDGTPDDGLIEDWYVDGDDDGEPGGEPLVTCDPPEGAVDTSTDCDDDDPTVYDGAPERCDGLDNDCDGDIDEPTWDEDFEGNLDTNVNAFNGDAEATTRPLIDGNTGEQIGEESFARLTAEQPQEAGTLWYRGQVGGEAFELSFRARLGSAGGGEGFTVAMFAEPRYNLKGPSGPGLGIYSSDVDGYVVEFDSRNNGADDAGAENILADDHIAVGRIDDGTLIAVDTTIPDFSDQEWHDVRILWANGLLSAYVDDQQTVFASLDDYDPDLLTVGFTASTAANFDQEHDIDDVLLACPPGAGGSDTADTGP